MKLHAFRPFSKQTIVLFYLCFWCCCLVFQTGSHVAQAGLELTSLLPQHSTVLALQACLLLDPVYPGFSYLNP